MIKLLSSASSLPEKILTNRDLEKIVDTSDEWITRMTGIEQRRVLEPGQIILDYAHQAAEKALQAAGLDPNDINLIIMGSSTTDQVIPSSASIIQGRLGIENCISFDLQAACSGFVYACSIAYLMMEQAPHIKNAIVLGAEALSRITNWEDRSTCVLFGDGAGAMVFSRSDSQEQTGILAYDMGCNGTGQEDLAIHWGVGRGYDTLNSSNQYIYMNGREVFKKSIVFFKQSIEAVLKKANVTLDQVDWIIPHQANDRILQTVAEKLGADPAKFVSTIRLHGNTSAASIPLAYDLLAQQGKIKPGQLVLMSAFGGGFTWASLLVRV